MTLVEVLAALALLGSLLAGLLVARAGLVRQWADSQRRLDAIDAADTLLNRWWLVAPTPQSHPGAKSENQPGTDDGPDAAGMPSAGSEGVIPGGRTGWRWRVTAEDEPALSDLNVRIGRLEIMDEAGVVLSSVALVVPQPSDEIPVETDER